MAIGGDPSWPSVLPHPPTTAGWLALWSLTLAVAYALARLIADKARHRRDEDVSIGMDCLAFSSSVILLLGTIFPHSILVAIGDPGPFLQIAGVQGLAVTLRTGFWRKGR